MHPAFFSFSSSPFQILSPKGADRHAKGGGGWSWGSAWSESINLRQQGRAWSSRKEGVCTVGAHLPSPPFLLSTPITWGDMRLRSSQFQSYLSPSREWCSVHPQLTRGREGKQGAHSQLVADPGASKQRGGENKNHFLSTYCVPDTELSSENIL